MGIAIILMSLLLFLKSSSRQFSSQWQWLNPKPAGHNNLKICLFGANDGFILNYNGDLIRTKDRGNTWAIQQNFPLARTMDLKDSTGIIAGFSNSIYISTDNGTSWQKKVINQYQEL